MLTNHIYPQSVIDWSDLIEGISWKSKGNIPGFNEAVFSPELESLDGKEIIITGYLLVLGGSQSIYLLSMNPMASCFFCGNGGPETIMELQFKEKPAFKMDDLLSVNGILRLNADDANRCYYIIEKAEAFNLYEAGTIKR